MAVQPTLCSQWRPAGWLSGPIHTNRPRRQLRLARANRRVNRRGEQNTRREGPWRAGAERAPPPSLRDVREKGRAIHNHTRPPVLMA
eukprot:scaffold5717_cov112-Isochrysis_galbana.AAC.16